MARSAIVLACLCCFAAGGAASELRIDDLRLSYHYMPDNGETSSGPYHDVASDGSVDSAAILDLVADRTQSRQRVALGWYWSQRELDSGRGSLVLGVEAAFDHDPIGSSTQRSVLGDVFIGWAWPLAPAWHIEEGFVGGAGRQRSSTNAENAFSDGSTAYYSDATFAYEYGARLGVRWTTPIRLQLGLDLEYMVMVSHPRYADEHQLAGGVVERATYHPTYRQEGFVGAVVLGYRL